MKLVCITDVHGYLEEALKAIQELEHRTELRLLDDRQWSSEHKLVLNGDMFDRGSQNRESLKWALKNADVYNIGNHEFFALFPDITEEFMSESYFEKHGENGLYWKNIDEQVRHSVIQAVANGKITAGFKQYDYT
ncbi:MAG: metallophosphoesterase [Candidatus Nanohaloarchaea archaeon]